MRSVHRVLVTGNIVPSSPILLTLMMKALGSSETSVLIRAKHRNISEDRILHSHSRENLKTYIVYTSFHPPDISFSLDPNSRNTLFSIADTPYKLYSSMRSGHRAWVPFGIIDWRTAKLRIVLHSQDFMGNMDCSENLSSINPEWISELCVLGCNTV
jgi:hypothetical protein